MQGFEDAQDLVDVAAERQRIIQQRPDNALRVDKEDGAHRGGIAHRFVHHAKRFRHLLIKVRDHRELHLHAEVLFDVAHPGDVRIHAVDGVADQLHVALLEFRVIARELDEFGGADGREVRRVREQQHPFAFGGVVAQLDDAVRGLRLELRRGLIDTRDMGSGAYNVGEHIFLLIFLDSR